MQQPPGDRGIAEHVASQLSITRGAHARDGPAPMPPLPWCPVLGFSGECGDCRACRHRQSVRDYRSRKVGRFVPLRPVGRPVAPCDDAAVARERRDLRVARYLRRNGGATIHRRSARAATKAATARSQAKAQKPKVIGAESKPTTKLAATSVPGIGPVCIKQEGSNLVEELAMLRARYLAPQVRDDCELPGGMILRRPRHSRIAIEQWPHIHRKVQLLEKRGEEIKVLWLLKKLRRHEIEGVVLGEAAPAGGEEFDDSCAKAMSGVIDLTDEAESPHKSFSPIDVDTYVMAAWDVQYERTIKPEQSNPK